ncbi:DUF5071 domain-containing protein [Ornithinibacillus scapharcae]|uniref:DUF5071 domain-containing protein n=1 Tax=Ornithinibacillus scapharcae TaxID=1147159 RepID=UPI000225B81A|nr:DUF5071 domain-containing protein [Ornithinibacillus scapharcae]
MIPKNKFDTNAIVQLQQASKEEVVPILPELLTWIQDINWPIATEIVNLLRTYYKETVPYIKNILISDDSIWKYWCLLELIQPMEKNYQLLFYKEVQQLAYHPSESDKIEEIDIIAREILTNRGGSL